MPTVPFHDEPLPTDDPVRRMRWDRRVEAWAHADDEVADIQPASADAEPEQPCSK